MKKYIITFKAFIYNWKDFYNKNEAEIFFSWIKNFFVTETSSIIDIYTLIPNILTYKDLIEKSYFITA